MRTSQGIEKYVDTILSTLKVQIRARLEDEIIGQMQEKIREIAVEEITKISLQVDSLLIPERIGNDLRIILCIRESNEKPA
jgi:hypothetical protein